MATRSGRLAARIYSGNTAGHPGSALAVARGLGAYAPLDFSRNATLPDGTSGVAFSLAFATDAGLPRLAFFTCHANGASRVVETVLATPDPAAHRRFFEQLIESEADAADGMLSIGPPDKRITALRASSG